MNTPPPTASSSDKPQAQALELQVLRLVEQGQMKQALAQCQQLNRSYPQFASGWYTASQLAARFNNLPMALQAIAQAVQLQPAEPKWQLQKASCLLRLGQLEAARPIVQTLDKLTLASAFQCASLGLLLSRLDMNRAALRHYQRAIALEPTAGEHHYNCASVHRFLGEVEAAEQALNKALALNPEDFQAYKLRADLRTQDADSNHVEQLETVLARQQKDPRAGVQLHYALAKELEDLKRWPQSFQHLQQGAALRRSLMRYELQGDLDTMAAIAQAYPQAATPPDDSELGSGAIFVLGMPRTGSTLVERILGSHSQVHSMGELNNFAQQMSQAVQASLSEEQRRDKLSKIERVNRSAALDFGKLGANYLQSLGPSASQLPHFVDKMPLNFLYAGLIHRALPAAKIIHIHRHPLDSCYAIYKTLFTDAYPFSYQLEELGRYYAAYQKLMAHWHATLPGVIYDISYEQLINDQAGQTRALLQHCQLEWQEQCLEFQHNSAASTTASASQIRQPLYRSSLQKWRHYADQLAPLIQILESEGIALDD